MINLLEVTQSLHIFLDPLLKNQGKPGELILSSVPWLTLTHCIFMLLNMNFNSLLSHLFLFPASQHSNMRFPQFKSAIISTFLQLSSFLFMLSIIMLIISSWIYSFQGEHIPSSPWYCHRFGHQCTHYFSCLLSILNLHYLYSRSQHNHYSIYSSFPISFLRNNSHCKYTLYC